MELLFCILRVLKGLFQITLAAHGHLPPSADCTCCTTGRDSPPTVSNITKCYPAVNNPLVLVTFREVWRKSNFAQIGIEYENGHMHTYIKGSQVEIHIQTHLNSKGSSKNAQPHIFAQQYSSATIVSIKINLARILKIVCPTSFKIA